MALPKEFWEQLPSKSDGQLCDMLAHPDDYVPEALSAARSELEKRRKDFGSIGLTEPAGPRIPLEAQAEGRPSKSPRARAFLFLFGGLVGGTLLVVVISLSTDNWSHLTRWLSGLFVVFLVFVWVAGKRWMARRVGRLADQMADSSLPKKPDE